MRRPGIRAERTSKLQTCIRKTPLKRGFLFPSSVIHSTGPVEAQSLHCHGLGEVARLVDVRAAMQRRVIGEQLQRYRMQNG